MERDRLLSSELIKISKTILLIGKFLTAFLSGCEI